MPSVSPGEEDFGKSVDNEFVINEDDDIDIDFSPWKSLRGAPPA